MNYVGVDQLVMLWFKKKNKTIYNKQMLNLPNGDSVELRDDAEIFILNGDNMWGSSIAWWHPEEHDSGSNIFKIVGWVSPKPQIGDYLLAKMASGKWGKLIFIKVDYCGDPPDMFFADAAGVLEYVDKPEYMSATSLIKKKSVFV